MSSAQFGWKPVMLLAEIAMPFASGTARSQGSESQAFVQKAAFSNTFEIEAAKVAVARWKDDSGKQFAQEMINDHTKAASDLETAARAERIAVPAGLSDEDGKKLAALNGASDADFDQAYLSTQVTAHEDAVSLFTAFAKSGPDGPVKNFATATIGTLRTHTIKAHGLTDNK